MARVNVWEQIMSPRGWRDDTPESRKEARAAIRTWDDYQWEKYLADIANGLGWATSESMSDADDGEVLAVTRELVRRVRARRLGSEKGSAAPDSVPNTHDDH